MSENPSEGHSLGVVIVGCGYWGVNYVRIFNELTGVRVVAICDERRGRLQEVGGRFPGASLETSLETALKVNGVHAVVVCTGATTHYDIARRCLEAGKHVLVEKPVATTVDDAEALVSLAAFQGVTLMVGHTFLYNPGVYVVKDYIDRADIGYVRYLYARRTNLGPIRHDVNAVWDLAPHDISIFNHLLNSEPQWVSAIGIRVLGNAREDVGFISLGYPNGIVGNIHVSWADPSKVRELVVVGSEKRIAFDDTNISEQVKVFEKGVTPQQVEPSSYGEYHFLMRDGNIVSPRVEVSEPLKNQCNHFLNCVNQRTKPLTDGHAGLAIVRVMSAVDESIKLNGAPVFIHHRRTPANAA
jgi:predicted dehydrogenase